MGIFDEYIDEPAKKQAAKDSEFDEFLPPPAPAPSPPRNDYAVTTATNQQERVNEAKQRGREGFAGERAVSAAESAGYGAARALTLGGVDRLVGLGTQIGESLAATEGKTAPADPQANQKARDEYLAGEAEAERFSPVSNFIGNTAGGMVSTAALSPLSIASKLQKLGRTGKVVQGAARAADTGVVGGITGALNTYENAPIPMLKGAAIGATAGALFDATLGNLARKAIRGAPQREEAAFISDVVESEAGRATPTTGRKLAKDIEDVADMRKVYPEVAKATRHNAPAVDAIPVVRNAQRNAMDGQLERYAQVDKVLGKKNQMTDVKLLDALVKAEDDLPNNVLTDGKKALKLMRDALRNDFVPRWTGSPINQGAVPISTDQLRQFVSTAQSTAEAAMGSINGTNTSKVPTEVAKAVNRILERRLGTAAAVGAKKEVDAIREADRRFSALKRIEGALNDREWKETSKAMGISGRMAQQQKNTENAAALAMTAMGNPGAALAVKARGPLSSAYNYTAREVNDRLLKPLQEAAAAGKTWAEVSRFAAETGVPQSVARYVFDNIASGTSKDRGAEILADQVE